MVLSIPLRVIIIGICLVNADDGVGRKVGVVQKSSFGGRMGCKSTESVEVVPASPSQKKNDPVS